MSGTDDHSDERGARSAKRSAGTGALMVRTDSSGREVWYGKWRVGGTQVKRRLGPKRTRGSRDGLTRVQAEAELRRLINEVTAVAEPGERRTVAEAGEALVAARRGAGRKRSTVENYESIIAIRDDAHRSAPGNHRDGGTRRLPLDRSCLKRVTLTPELDVAPFGANQGRRRGRDTAEREYWFRAAGVRGRTPPVRHQQAVLVGPTVLLVRQCRVISRIRGR